MHADQDAAMPPNPSPPPNPPTPHAAGAALLAFFSSLLLLAAAQATGEHSYTDRVPNQHQSSNTRKHAINGSGCNGRSANRALAFPALVRTDVAAAALL